VINSIDLALVVQTGGHIDFNSRDNLLTLMGGKLSVGESPIGEHERAVEGPALSGSVNGLNHSHHRHHHRHHHHRLTHQTSPAGGSSGPGGGSGAGRPRTRSHGGYPHHRNHGSPSAEVPDTDRSPLGDGNVSPVLERPRSRSLVTAGTQGALPLHLFSFHGNVFIYLILISWNYNSQEFKLLN